MVSTPEIAAGLAPLLAPQGYSELLAAEYGPVPEEYLAEARAAWPDSE
jgi:hypothetical protein